MHDMRRTTVVRAMVREERLRATAGVTAGSELSSWRGRSGRRYVVGIHPLCLAEIGEADDAVLIAVRRDGEGGAHLVDAAVSDAPAAWLAAMRSGGATELHVHRLAAGEAGRRAVVQDLLEAAAGEGAQASATAIDARVGSLTPMSMSC